MPIPGHQTVGQLRRILWREEQNPERRERLFERFGGPRAALVRGLTEKVLEFVVNEWDGLNGSRVLDYGCGVLPYERAFSSAGALVCGADIGTNPAAELKLSEDGRLSVPENTFNYVVSFQVLEHVPDPEGYLREAYRVLKPGGKLFLTTHGMWPYHPTPTDYHRWTKDGLSMEVTRSGFQIRTTGYILNEISAAIQHLVINAEYRGKWGRAGRIVHLATHLMIDALEKWSHSDPQLPTVLTIVGVK